MKPENTEEPRGRLQEMAQVDVMETPHQTAAYQEEEKENKTLLSPAVIEILDSTNECEEEGRSEVPQMEEKAFVARLHAFMKDRGSPIERIPHLGFKQINLWMIYKAVEKLGGYDSVTARRLWKKVYDELGGSPGSTSAATCTRRHYERLVLPFERHVKGEEDKPLPQSKPRKPYKRNLDAKMSKVEGKRKRPQSDRELDTESPEAPCQSEAAMHPHSALWPATPECPQSSRVGADLCLCASVYACPHHLQVPAAGAWTPHVLASAGEVISPLEKKKRMAQASLNLPASPQGEEKERPSVIHCSQSPGWAPSGRNCNSSDGSPQPQSSSSSRSPSPCSVSSEDTPAGNNDKAATSSSDASGCPSSAKSSTAGGEDASQSCSRVSKDASLHKKETAPASLLTPDSLKGQVKHFPHPFYTSYAVKSDWAPTSTSSFTKVVPKSGPLPRPAPVWPGYKIHQSRAMHHDDTHACAKKAKGGLQWLYHTEKKDKSRTMLQKVPPTAQSLSHAAPVPLSCVLSGYDKSGRDSRHQPPPHPAYYPSRMRIPQPQQLYRHFPVSPAHSAIYPYPYSIPLLPPHTGYILPAMNPIYPHKL